MAKKPPKELSLAKLEMAQKVMEAPKIIGNTEISPEVEQIVVQEITEKKEISEDYYTKQIDEANARFLEVSEKLHSLEAENDRLTVENEQLKSKCSELEKKIASQENDLFEANITISSKLDQINSLEADLERIKINPNPYNIPMQGPKGKMGLNGYETWN